MRIAIALLVLLTTPALAAPPPCYQPHAVNITVRTIPASQIDCLLAADCTFTVSWYCAAGGAWFPVGFYGHKSELGADFAQWMAQIANVSKAQLDGLWTANIDPKSADAGLKAVLQLQLAATLPAPPIPPKVPVYYIVQQHNIPKMLPAGTILSTTPVDTSKTLTVGGRTFCVVDSAALIPFSPTAPRPGLLYSECTG